MQRFPVISNAREELADAVGSGSISPPSPIACSPWLVMSIMQKAIRRGREDLALRAAASLLRDFARRLCQSNCSSYAYGIARPDFKQPSGREGAPLGQFGRASLLVDLAGDEVALPIEMVVDLGVN